MAEMTGRVEADRKAMAERHTSGTWTMLLAVLLALGARVITADTPGQTAAWKMVGQIGGPTQGIAVQGGHAVVGVGMRLVVLDVSDPADLREVGATAPFPHSVEDVALSGSLAYVAADSSGLRVVDVSNPALPTEVGTWDSRGKARGVTVAGGIAYVADGPHGLRLVDVSTPAQPVELGSAYPLSYAFDVAVEGHYAYIAAAGAGLLIADVSDPGRPVEVGSLVTDGYAYGVAVAGSTVFLADGWEGVKIIDVADAARPALVGAYKTPGWAFGLTVAGTKAYVADAFGGLRVLDVTDAAHPVEIGSSQAPGEHACGVAVAGDTGFVADRNWGVRAVNLSAGPDLPQVGSFHPIGYADGVAVSGTHAYVAGASGGFFVIDISDPARPIQRGNLSAEGHSLDVVVGGPFAYLTTQGSASAGLHAIDVTDPTRPARVGFFGIHTGQPRGLGLAGDHVYAAIETGLEILNVSDPAHPTRAGFLRTQEAYSDFEVCVGVRVEGSVAHLALERGGYASVDVSDPAHPVRRGDFDPGPSFLVRDVAVSATRAYVADTAFGLRILDVSDPSHPVAMGSLRTPGPHALTVAGNFAYLAVGDYGMVAVDVSDPDHPIVAGNYRTWGYTRKIAVADGRLVLADGTNGLLILELTPGAARADRFAETGAPDQPVLDAGFASHPPPPPQLQAAAAARRTASDVSAAASDCLVTSASDNGAGTLRQCLLGSLTGTTITFDPAVFPPAAPASIRLLSALPGLPGGVIIDGSDAGVIVDGSDSGANIGLFVQSDGNTIRGLQILRFPGTGIQIQGSGNVIGGDRSVGRGPVGQGNVVSGNTSSGIMISGDGGGGAARNVVVGNFIGTDASGTRAMGNGVDGMWVQKAANNRIGGPEVRDRNIVSGNGWSGIMLAGKATENLVEGNFVGTDVTGSFAVGNLHRGIHLGLGAFANVIRGNLVSGNPDWAMAIEDHGSSYNAVLGNRIGTDATGTRAIPNGGLGVLLNAGVSGFNRVGGIRPEERNLVSGNLQGGIVVMTRGNLIRGNYVGTDVTGRNPLGNGEDGVRLSSSGNILGGAVPEEANVIAANGSFGVSASGDHSVILGNHIGTDPTGLTAMGNARSGVSLGGRHSIVQGNVIAHTMTSAGFGSGSGVSVGPELDCTIRRNSIHHNAGAGIESAAEPPAPIITGVTPTSVTGTACGGCEVEIFSDSEDEGRVFEGSTQADGSGGFAFSAGSGTLTGPGLTATATDRDRGTSAFSARVRVPRPPRRHLDRR